MLDCEVFVNVIDAVVKSMVTSLVSRGPSVPRAECRTDQSLSV